MGKLTVALSDEAEKKLRARATRNLRSISKEIEYLVLEAEKKERGLKPF